MKPIPLQLNGSRQASTREPDSPRPPADVDGWFDVVLWCQLTHRDGQVPQPPMGAGALESAAYSASKHDIIGLTKASALDLARFHIRVNCICPGSIDTSMQAREFNRTKDPVKTRRTYDDIYPMGRIGKPEEVAELVLFLATERSSFITEPLS